MKGIEEQTEIEEFVWFYVNRKICTVLNKERVINFGVVSIIDDKTIQILSKRLLNV